MVHNAIKLIECPRDAWQGLKRQIPTELKARYLRALIEAGFKHIDAVSFVSTKAVPQMADSEKVLEQIDLPDDVEIIGIVVNEKGAERAIAAKAITTLGFPYSISETFLRKNQNQTLEDGCKVLESIKTTADKAGRDMVAYISMAFGNPYGDPWNEDEVCQAVKKLAGSGIRFRSLTQLVLLALILFAVLSSRSKINTPITTLACIFTARPGKSQQKCWPRTTPVAVASIRPSVALVDAHSRRMRWLETFLQRA